MLSRIPSRTQTQSGYTLIELLVVILIIGVLAAIAIPSFLNQKSKATDSSAKSLARSAETAAETYSTDHRGDYSGLSPSALQNIEPTIQTAPGNNNAYLTAASADGTGKGYTVTAVSMSSNTYSITRADDGSVTRTCTPSATSPNSGGC